jgi:hypothetical protein
MAHVDDPDDLLPELRREARNRLTLPATFMMIVAALGAGVAVTFSLVSWGFFGGPLSEDGLTGSEYAWLIGPVAVVWCGVIGYGAYQMSRLGNYQAAKVGAWLAVVPFPLPLYLLWLIGAILGLIAMSDPAVRAAFATGNPGSLRAYLARRNSRRRPRRSRGEEDGSEEKPFTDLEVVPSPEDGSDEQPFTDLEVVPSQNDLFGDLPRFDRMLEEGGRDVSTASTILLVSWVLAALFPLFLLQLAVGAALDGAMNALLVLGSITMIYFAVTSAGLYGVFRLRTLRSRAWGVASAVLLLVGFPMCLLGIILAVWVLVLLNRPGVHRLFRRANQDRGPPRRGENPSY